MDDSPSERTVRASDAEREEAVERLRTASAEGRLTLGELSARTQVAYTAATRAELERVQADLPAPRPQTPLAAVEPAKPRRWVLGILGGDTVHGVTRLAGEVRVVNVMGGADLDLSQAVIEGQELILRIVSVMGGADVWVPEGVHVEHSSFSLMGGDKVEEDQGPPPGPGAPVVRIRSVNVMGGSTIRRGRRVKRPGWRLPALRRPDGG